MLETWVRSLGREDPLEKEMVTHSSIHAWKIPWTEELSGCWYWRENKRFRLESCSYVGLHIETIWMVCLRPVCTCSCLCLSEQADCAAVTAPWIPGLSTVHSALYTHHLVSTKQSWTISQPSPVGNSGTRLPPHWEATVSTCGFQSSHTEEKDVGGSPDGPAHP